MHARVLIIKKERDGIMIVKIAFMLPNFICIHIYIYIVYAYLIIFLTLSDKLCCYIVIKK